MCKGTHAWSHGDPWMKDVHIWISETISSSNQNSETKALCLSVRGHIRQSFDESTSVSPNSFFTQSTLNLQHPPSVPISHHHLFQPSPQCYQKLMDSYVCLVGEKVKEKGWQKAWINLGTKQNGGNESVLLCLNPLQLDVDYGCAFCWFFMLFCSKKVGMKIIFFVDTDYYLILGHEIIKWGFYLLLSFVSCFNYLILLCMFLLCARVECTGYTLLLINGYV